ncbi:hypothetical protein IAD21_02032 [Abditibacteriota bacterium]|nr:hypothetical protein IAD21_02032 [Abditibacteriota bacterium]
MTYLYRFIWIFFAFWGAGIAHAQTDPEPQIVQLPSSVTTGNPTLDVIHFEWYPAQHLGADGKAPAIIALHSLGGDFDVPRGFARYFARRGIGAAVVELPYHFHRAQLGVDPASRYLSADSNLAAQTWKQAYSDVSSVLTWLEAQPSVDKNRLGATGISLGAVTIHGVMGQDPRLKAAVTFVGGGDFPYIFKHSAITRFSPRRGYKITDDDIAILHQIDPLAFASNNLPRRVLMIQGARDLIIPPRASHELWKALGRPPIRWLDTGHFGIGLILSEAHSVSYSFLQNAWNDAEQHGNDASRLRPPKIYAPVVKAGVLSGLDSNLTPAITVQVASIGTRPDHLAWVHADVGLTGRGFYAGIAATLNSFVDIGYGRRLGGDKFRPYVGTQLAF